MNWDLHWAQPVIDFVEKKLQGSGSVWEYGSGDSTVWLMSVASKVISIEHNKLFFDRINLPCVRLIESEYSGIRGDTSDPDGYFSDETTNTFRAYCSSIDGEGPFDVITIDGRARPSCIKHARSRIKQGGLIVLDDAERSYYHRAMNMYLPNAALYKADETKLTAIWVNK